MGFIYSSEESWAILEKGSTLEEAKTKGIDASRYRAWHDRFEDENRFRMYWLDRQERASRGSWSQDETKRFKRILRKHAQELCDRYHDGKLVRLDEQYAQWGLLSKHIPGRTGEQLRLKYKLMLEKKEIKDLFLLTKRTISAPPFVDSTAAMSSQTHQNMPKQGIVYPSQQNHTSATTSSPSSPANSAHASFTASLDQALQHAPAREAIAALINDVRQSASSGQEGETRVSSNILSRIAVIPPFPVRENSRENGTEASSLDTPYRGDHYRPLEDRLRRRISPPPARHPPPARGAEARKGPPAPSAARPSGPAKKSTPLPTPPAATSPNVAVTTSGTRNGAADITFPNAATEEVVVTTLENKRTNGLFPQNNKRPRTTQYPTGDNEPSTEEEEPLQQIGLPYPSPSDTNQASSEMNHGYPSMPQDGQLYLHDNTNPNTKRKFMEDPQHYHQPPPSQQQQGLLSNQMMMMVDGNAAASSFTGGYDAEAMIQYLVDIPQKLAAIEAEKNTAVASLASYEEEVNRLKAENAQLKSETDAATQQVMAHERELSQKAHQVASLHLQLAEKEKHWLTTCAEREEALRARFQAMLDKKEAALQALKQEKPSFPPPQPPPPPLMPEPTADPFDRQIQSLRNECSRLQSLLSARGPVASPPLVQQQPPYSLPKTTVDEPHRPAFENKEKKKAFPDEADMLLGECMLTPLTSRAAAVKERHVPSAPPVETKPPVVMAAPKKEKPKAAKIEWTPREDHPPPAPARKPDNEAPKKRPPPSASDARKSLEGLDLPAPPKALASRLGRVEPPPPRNSYRPSAKEHPPPPAANDWSRKGPEDMIHPSRARSVASTERRHFSPPPPASDARRGRPPPRGGGHHPSNRHAEPRQGRH